MSRRSRNPLWQHCLSLPCGGRLNPLVERFVNMRQFVKRVIQFIFGINHTGKGEGDKSKANSSEWKKLFSSVFLAMALWATLEEELLTMVERSWSLLIFTQIWTKKNLKLLGGKKLQEKKGKDFVHWLNLKVMFGSKKY